MKGSFIDNLGKIYGIYTGGFLGFVVFIAILEQLGVPNRVLGYLFVGMTISVYAAIGILSRTAKISEYYVAGRAVPPVFNGMATGADWMSGASFVALAGSVYALGYDGLAFILGWTGGYVLVAIFLAPYLRKFGAFTVPDFLGARYEGNAARIIGVLVLFCASFTYVTAQIYSTGIIASRFLGISFEVAVFVGLAGILVCSMLGGMRAVTWTQVAQYIVLIVAYLLPVVWLSFKKTGIPIPQLTYGGVMQEVVAKEKELGLTKFFNQPFANYDRLNFFGLIFCLMIGTASLPHILMRYFTTPSVRAARQSVAWSLLFIFLLYFTAPAYATFARWEILHNVIGQPIAALPEWVARWSEVAGLLKIDDANADGILQYSEFVIKRDIVVLATPEIAGMPYVVSGLVAAGGLAAALSTADGLLLAIANALSHDIYGKMINPNASTFKRLLVARVLLLLVAAVAATLASTKPGHILAMVAWAFSIAASGLFAPLVLGVWWKQCNRQGAVAGMLAGFVICVVYLVVTRYAPQFGVDFLLMTPFAGEVASNQVGWFGVRNISAGLFGIPASFIAMIVVSRMYPAPSESIRRMVDLVRVPIGGVLTTDDRRALGLR